MISDEWFHDYAVVNNNLFIFIINYFQQLFKFKEIEGLKKKIR